MDRTIVVTGGSRGIGKAVAARFARLGDRVVVTGRDEGRLSAVASELGAVGIRCDGSDVDDVTRLAEELRDGVDVLVNVAGSNAQAPFADPDDPTLGEIADAWHASLRANLMSTVLTTSALMPLMRAGGALIGFGSNAAEFSPIPYAAAKAAIAAWITGLSSRLGPRGITANTIVPGYTAGTAFFATPLPDERIEAMIAGAHTRRAATPEDIAGVAVFLAGEDARHITGQAVHVSGGSHTTR